MSYVANYGYKDGSGEWYIILDGNKCDGCGKCEDACPEKMYVVEEDDYEDLVTVVKKEVRQKIKYLCNPCKAKNPIPPCYASCKPGAISHSW